MGNNSLLCCRTIVSLRSNAWSLCVAPDRLFAAGEAERSAVRSMACPADEAMMNASGRAARMASQMYGLRGVGISQARQSDQLIRFT